MSDRAIVLLGILLLLGVLLATITMGLGLEGLFWSAIIGPSRPS